MILLDTSVVIDELRRPDAETQRLFIEMGAVICGVTRAEVLQGTRSPDEMRAALAALDGFPQLSIPEELWDALGQNLARLETVGRRVPLADAIIATLAIYHSLELWTRNGHHDTFQQVIPELKLFAEPGEQQP